MKGQRVRDKTGPPPLPALCRKVAMGVLGRALRLAVQQQCPLRQPLWRSAPTSAASSTAAGMIVGPIGWCGWCAVKSRRSVSGCGGSDGNDGCNCACLIRSLAGAVETGGFDGLALLI